jgi:hypothetical protein
MLKIKLRHDKPMNSDARKLGNGERLWEPYTDMLQTCDLIRIHEALQSNLVIRRPVIRIALSV